MDAFLYAYLVGGTVFGLGLWQGAKQGYISFRGRGLRNLLGCLAVLLFFAILQGYLQYAPMESAPAKAYDGGAEKVLDDSRRIRGTTLDYSIVGAYFLIILVIGTWCGRKQKTTKDFFFGGQRFSWWLIAMSLIATTVGSYSFVKYSEIGYAYGIGAAQTYWNDWLWLPLLAFGWLPILYFSRIVSIPEYFGRRYGSQTRAWATAYLLLYLIGYVGVNLFTMGTVLNVLLGWPIPVSAFVVALVSLSYVTSGGQTSVIMTDLFQGALLLIIGLLIIVLGASYLGGFDVLWANLPRESKLAFPNFNDNADYPAVGVFWQDAIANSAMFYFLNQGIIMRFLAAKSLDESRKAVIALMVGLMTIGAIVVASGGLVARAFTNAGVLPEVSSKEAFFVASELLSQPGVFGLILAAMTAALMSTVDTLITAVAAVVVNDLYRPYCRPHADERELLKAARISSVAVTMLGVVMVPVFMQFKSVYLAHAAFTAAVTPPMVVALLLAVFWPRFTKAAAFWTLAGGLAAIVLSMAFPVIIEPFAHGVPAGESDGTFFGGIKQQQFMRACFGIVVCLAIGIGVTLFTKPETKEKQRGLVWGTVADALRSYKGSPGTESRPVRATAMPRALETDPPRTGDAGLPGAILSRSAAAALRAGPGDLLYVTDSRSWTGGMYSAHVVVGEIINDESPGLATVGLGREVFDSIVTRRRRERIVKVERLYGTEA